MSTLYEKVPNEFLCSSKLEEHKFVKRFEGKQKTDPEYKSSLIEAYIVRDLYFNSNETIKTLFEGHCNKLRLNPTDQQTKTKREYEFIKSVKTMMENQNFTDETLNSHYNKFINRDETHKEMEDRSKYNSIMAMIDENEDIEDIYKEFTLEELFYLGW